MKKEKRTKTSPGQATHRRRTIASARDTDTQREITIRRERTGRLAEVQGLLADGANTGSYETALLRFEEICLGIRLKEIDHSVGQSQLTQLLDLTKEHQAEVYERLTAQDNDNKTPLSKIRSRVFSTVIAGYHTKR